MTAGVQAIAAVAGWVGPVAAEWMDAHIVAHLREPTPPAYWQWGLTLRMWLLETAGVQEVAVADPEHYQDLLNEVGFAMRRAGSALF